MKLALLLPAFLLGLQGCASVAKPDPRDPLESLNRGVFTVNTVVDSYVAKPIAKTYAFVVPQVFRGLVTNFFSNLGEVTNAANNLLQGKPKAALGDTARLLVNSTFGFGGIADVASEMGLKRSNEDFGQTLGVWGVPNGPYLVLPFYGPSTIRDVAGRVVDTRTNPVTYFSGESDRWIATGGQLADLRVSLFALDRLLEQTAVDPYIFVRDAYLQRRRNAVYDGDPPDAPPAYEKEDADEKPGPKPLK
jgi:phospholipid-binding lipoprotein MlaA